jgi:Cation/multidrug efflux pump
VGEGGEFYRPMAVAIIGGTITSTMLTLLVVPTFYDSIEIARDRAFAKFRRRSESHFPAFAFVVTLLEAILTLLGLRALYRWGSRAIGRMSGRKRSPVVSPEVEARAGD